ncbi:MAG: VgrG-related protein [Anaerolineae bacterium]|nr:VgrG-related protein [Anaerolineae bacterium]
MATAGTYLSQFFIKIGNDPLPPELVSSIIEVVVEDNLHLPDMFAIHLHDKQMKWTNSELFAIGQAVEIAAQAPQFPSQQVGLKTTLIRGEITGLEPDLLESGVPSLVVRGYDRAYYLHQGQHTRSFLQSTDSEIAQKIAEEVELNPAGIQATQTVHEHIVQSNQTNMEFLLERARCLGFEFFVEDETLYFRPDEPDEEPPPQLTWGSNLLSFRSVLTAVHQVGEAVVRGWDPYTKREVIGRATEAKSIPEVRGQERVQQRFRGSNQILLSRPVHSQAEAEALAQALRDEVGGELIQAEGVCVGEPKVQAGKRVKIVGLGQQFDGEYLVTLALHTYSAEHGYETSFSIGGRKAETLSALLDQRRQMPQLGQGLVIGLVTNNQDPNGLGRIKVKYPGLDDLDESPWVRIAAPMAGQNRGFYYLPEINDEVLIAFEQGDVHRPYMLGMLWNGSDKPPEANNAVVGSDGRVNRRLIRSRSGHEISLEDTAEQEKIVITDKSGNKITMEQNSMSITVKGNLRIEATGNITIKGTTIDLIN